MGGTTSGLVLLGSIREQAEQASKKHPSMASASARPANTTDNQIAREASVRTLVTETKAT